MIIRTSDGQLYRVRETNDPDLQHVWIGVRVKRQASKSVVFPGPVYVAKSSRQELVRKAASTIVAQEG